MAETNHADVGAYVLGVLDEPDNAAFEAHLLECARCRQEYRELQDLPGLLDDVKQTWPAAPVPPSPRSPDDWTPGTRGRVSIS